MKKKMGRPPFPKGEAKDFQVGLRLNAEQKAIIGEKAELAKQEMNAWIRDQAYIAALDYWGKSKWKAKDLHGKKVAFSLVGAKSGSNKATGAFDAWENGDGLLHVRINYYHRETETFRIFVIPPKQLDLIRRLPPGDFGEFGFTDPDYTENPSPKDSR